MIRVLLVASLFILILHARENPFFPSEGEKDIPVTSNEDTVIPPLKRVTITLPAQARVLQNVTVSYKNLDGSVDTQSINLENSVDWHLPIFISQSYEPIAEVHAKEETANKEVVVNKIALKKKNLDINSTKNSVDYKQIASMDFAKFYASKKNFKIVTTDKMLRNFLLVQPHRIVADFERESNMKSYDVDATNGIFTRIRIGNHDGYYRVVIELDGYYRYSVKNVDGEYIFKLK